MANTCKHCGTSLGLLARLKGVKPSANDTQVCNKCAEKMQSSTTQEPTEQVSDQQ